MKTLHGAGRVARAKIMVSPVAFAALVGLLACGDGDNTLDGSIGEQYSLDFDEVWALKQGDDLIIEYRKNITGGAEKVVKIVVDGEDLELGSGKRLAGQTFLDHVHLSRVTRNVSAFPDVQSGAIQWKTLELASGGKCEGEFEAVFAEGGRTLSGKFNASIRENDPNL